MAMPATAPVDRPESEPESDEPEPDEPEPELDEPLPPVAEAPAASTSDER